MIFFQHQGGSYGYPSVCTISGLYIRCSLFIAENTFITVWSGMHLSLQVSEHCFSYICNDRIRFHGVTSSAQRLGVTQSMHWHVVLLLIMLPDSGDIVGLLAMQLGR